MLLIVEPSSSVNPARPCCVSSQTPGRGRTAVVGRLVDGWGDGTRCLPERSSSLVPRVGRESRRERGAGGIKRHQRRCRNRRPAQPGSQPGSSHAVTGRLPGSPAADGDRPAGPHEEHRRAAPGREQRRRRGPNPAIPGSHRRDLRTSDDEPDRVALDLGAAGDGPRRDSDRQSRPPTLPNPWPAPGSPECCSGVRRRISRSPRSRLDPAGHAAAQRL
jgi:hypothetical protein